MTVSPLLSQVDLFKVIPLHGLMDLARRGRMRRFTADSQLMRQGDMSDCMYIVAKGRVRVERNHPDLTEPLVLAELGPGDVVGEMGVLDDEPRSATVTALEDTEAIELDASALAEALARFPEAASVMLRVLSRRLRTTDELLELARRRPPTAGGA